MKIIELLIDEENQVNGIEAVSLVSAGAIESASRLALHSRVSRGDPGEP